MNLPCLAAQEEGAKKQTDAVNREWLIVSAKIGGDEKVQDADKNVSV